MNSYNSALKHLHVLLQNKITFAENLVSAHSTSSPGLSLPVF